MTEVMEQHAGGMKIKSYFASSVEKAIQEARQEMGADAVLLTTRRSSPEARHLGTYEVVFGSPAPSGAAVSNTPAVDLNTELQNLQAQLEQVKSALHIGRARPEVAGASVPDELCRELVDSGFDRDLAWQIAQEAVEAWRQAPPTSASLHPASRLHQFAVDSISKRLRCALPSAHPQEPGRIVVFVGPPGAGKTTSLVKFAVQRCLAAQQSARIISFDPMRVAAHEKLRALAGVIGMGFTAAATVNEFAAAMEEFRAKHVVLVDTPGYGPRDFESASDISSCIGRISRKEIHLVLPALMKHADLSRTIRRYEIFAPDYLLITKVDETDCCGAVLSAVIESGKPLSFLSNGQNIPEDLVHATPEALTTYLNVREPAGATSAA